MSIIKGLPFDDYRELEGINHSSLCDYLKSPALFQGRHVTGTIPQKESAAFRFGTLTHLAVLEPERFDGLAVCADDDPEVINPSTGKPYGMSTKKGEAWLAKQHQAGRLPVTRDELDALCGIRDSVLTHPVASGLLRECPLREVTLTGTHYPSVMPVKGRIDACSEDMTVLADIKKTTARTIAHLRDMKPWALTEYHYDTQLPYYDMLAASNGRQKDSQLWYIFVDEAPPHTVVCVRLGDDVIVEARAKIDSGLTEVADRMSQKQGSWIDFPSAILWTHQGQGEA